MKKLRRTLSIIFPALAMLGTLAVSSHAKKPVRPPAPTSVEVQGAIQGTGDPKAIRVTFDDSLAHTYPAGCTQGPVFISNPDRTDSLNVLQIAGPMRIAMMYYYCAHEDHAGSADLVCHDEAHNPGYYYCLTIGHGVTGKKKPKANYDHVSFPIGSPWEISWKVDNSVVKAGELSSVVTYDIVE